MSAATPTARIRERILWWGNVRGLSYPERLAFAAAHGFDALNVSPFDVVALLERGETLGSIRRMAEDAAVRLTYLDPVVSWLPDWEPEGPAREMLPFLSAGLGTELDTAEALGIDRVLTITCFGAGRHGLDAVAEHLGAFADEAAGRGITCVVEAMPMWGVPTFAEAVVLWRAVDRPNVKLLFDTWHYCRGGRSDDLIQGLPVGAIDHVQIADGSAATPEGMSLFDDCLHHRLPIGEGELPLEDIVSMLAVAGHLGSVGPEVFSAELDGLDGDAIGRRLLPGFDAFVARCAASAPDSTSRSQRTSR